jgi:hypothetical protein
MFSPPTGCRRRVAPPLTMQSSGLVAVMSVGEDGDLVA